MNSLSGEEVRFHLIAVTRGSREAVLAYKNDEGMGSFLLNSAIKGNEHFNRPFVIGLPEPSKDFVHVFDEVSIDILLNELDTVSDFLDYLKKRETLLGKPERDVLAWGEEELLAAYMLTMDPREEEHVFINASLTQNSSELILFNQGFYKTLSENEGYKRKKKADEIVIPPFLAYFRSRKAMRSWPTAV